MDWRYRKVSMMKKFKYSLAVIMFNMVEYTRCQICGKETYTDMVTKQFVEERGYIMFVCKSCLLTGEFEEEIKRVLPDAR